MTEPQAQAPQPTQGGSYVRDPVTGELIRQEWTRVEPAAAPTQPEQPPQPE